MLGIRLDAALEGMLDAVARQQGRSKSQIAREAIRSYVERQDQAFRAEARRQSLAASVGGWSEEDASWEALGTIWDEPPHAAAAE